MSETAEQAVLTEEYRRNLALLRRFSHGGESEDVVIRDFTVFGKSAALLYVDGLAEENQIQRFLLQPLLNASGPPLMLPVLLGPLSVMVTEAPSISMA